MPGASEHTTKWQIPYPGPRGARDAAGRSVPPASCSRPRDSEKFAFCETERGEDFHGFCRQCLAHPLPFAAVVADKGLGLYWRYMKSRCLTRNFKGTGKGSICDSAILSLGYQKEEKVLDQRVSLFLWQFSLWITVTESTDLWLTRSPEGPLVLLVVLLFTQGSTWYITCF